MFSDEYSGSEMFNSTFDFLRERIIRKYLADVLPFYSVFSDQYETQRIKTGHADKEMNIEWFMKNLVKHDIYKEVIDPIERIPWFRKFANGLTIAAVYQGIAYNLKGQIYNFNTGQVANLIMEPVLTLKTIAGIYNTGPELIRNAYNIFADRRVLNSPGIIPVIP